MLGKLTLGDEGGVKPDVEVWVSSLGDFDDFDVAFGGISVSPLDALPEQIPGVIHDCQFVGRRGSGDGPDGEGEEAADGGSHDAVGETSCVSAAARRVFPALAAGGPE